MWMKTSHFESDPARLEDEHPVRRIGTQPVGEHTPGRSAPDDDEVVRPACHGPSGFRVSQPRALPRSATDRVYGLIGRDDAERVREQWRDRQEVRKRDARAAERLDAADALHLAAVELARGKRRAREVRALKSQPSNSTDSSSAASRPTSASEHSRNSQRQSLHVRSETRSAGCGIDGRAQLSGDVERVTAGLDPVVPVSTAPRAGRAGCRTPDCVDSCRGAGRRNRYRAGSREEATARAA